MRILVVRNDKIGDLVLALPLVEALKEAGHEVGVLASAYAAPLLEHDTRVATRIVDGPEALAQIKAAKFDAALLLWGKWRNAALAFRAGIPKRVGASWRPFSLLCGTRVDARRSRAEKKESETNLDFGRALGIEIPTWPPRPPRLRLAPEDHAAAEAALKSLGLERPVMLHPGSRGSAQNWAPERYALLGRELGAQGEVLLVTGGPGEEALAAEVAQGCGAHTLQQSLPLRAFAALVGKARLFVSASTGPMHLAAAGGAPTLSLFPPLRAMSPRRWGPQGNAHAVLLPDGLGTRAPRIAGLNYVKRISLDQALRAANALLEEARA